MAETDILSFLSHASKTEARSGKHLDDIQITHDRPNAIKDMTMDKFIRFNTAKIIKGSGPRSVAGDCSRQRSSTTALPPPAKSSQVDASRTGPRNRSENGISHENDKGKDRDDGDDRKGDGSSRAQDAFVQLMTKKELNDDHLASACRWYTTSLKSKIKEAWVSLFQPVLADICTATCGPCDACVELAFIVLSVITLELEQENPSVAKLVYALHNQGLLKNSDSDTARQTAHQLVFAAFGWISLLYPQNLLRKRTESQKIVFVGQEPEIWLLENRPLYEFLRMFGDIIPGHIRNAYFVPKSLQTSQGGRRGWIDLSLMCFNTLHKDLSLDVLWVDCLEHHLEFNQETRLLKLFRFPSICLIMCCNKNTSPLSQIFKDSARYRGSAASMKDTDNACQFFKEVLLSYRLIFGQTTSSYTAFNEQISKWDLDPQEDSDPLLYTLCGCSCESEEAQAIYTAVGAQDPSNHYSPKEDFPFLGQRIEKVQSYVYEQTLAIEVAQLHHRRGVSWW